MRNRAIIATKAGYRDSRFDRELPFTHPSHVELCCDASLNRLKKDVIDLFHCHQAFVRRPEVFLEAFEILIKRGKIRAGGISTNSADVAASSSSPAAPTAPLAQGPDGAIYVGTGNLDGRTQGNFPGSDFIYRLTPSGS